MKSFRILCAATALAALAAATSQAQVIDFTAAEGYSDGALAGQPSGGARWTEQTAGVWQVDAAAGTVSYNSNSVGQPWRAATFGGELPASNPITLQAVFSFACEYFIEAPRHIPFFRVGASVATTPQTHASILAYIVRKTNKNNTYQIAIYENAGMGWVFSSDIPADLLGLTSKTSDALRLSVTTTLVSGNDWKTVATLRNLVTDTDVASVSLDWTSDETWSASPKFLLMDTGEINELPEMTVTVDRILVTGKIPPTGGQLR